MVALQCKRRILKIISLYSNVEIMIDKKKQLLKHQAIATGLFVAMALLYIVMLYLQKQQTQFWIGYVKAFSEAAMIGALADWFAVTALFRHPLGLKIPHTNLIENSQKSIGKNLGGFITENFLTPKNIRPYIERLDVTSFASDWIEKKENQATIENEVCQIIEHIITRIEEETLVKYLSQKAANAIHDIPLQNIASQGILYILEKKELERLFVLLTPQIHSYIDNNKEEIYQAIIDRKPILGLIGGKSITNQIITGLHSFLDDITESPNHKIKVEIYDKLANLAVEMNNSTEWKEKLNTILSPFLTADKIEKYAQDFYTSIKTNLLNQLKDNTSSLRYYIRNGILDLKETLKNDKQLQHKINAAVRLSLYKLALKNAKEIGSIIENTVEQWDGKELSEKLELEVGKDLQYIRINGTLIGGLVGVLIYFITNLFV